MTKWVETKLGDVVNIKHGYAFDGKHFHDEPVGDILLTPGNFAIGGGFKADKLKYYDGPIPPEFILREGDLLITMTDLSKSADTLGYPALVPRGHGRRFLHNQRLGKVEVLPGARLDRRFLYYLLRTRKYRNEVLAGATGTTVKHTSPDRIKKFEFLCPPIAGQEAIANVLGALDDKIELNRRMNETLEAMARAIFKSWFVDFDPVRARAEGRRPYGMSAAIAALFPNSFEDSALGPIPRGWTITTLREHVEAIRGLSYNGEGLSDSGLPLHNLNSVYEGGGYKNEGLKRYTGDYKKRHVIEAGDLIVTNTEQGFDFLLIGYPAIVPKRFGSTGLFSHHLYRVRPRPESPVTTQFLYQLLLTPLVREQVIGCTNGTTVNMLALDGLEMPRFVLPPPALIKEFDRIAIPLYERSETNFDESETLVSLRDTLLPKLLSGEIRVDAKVRAAVGVQEGR